MKDRVWVLGKNNKICAALAEQLGGIGKNAVVFASPSTSELISAARGVLERGDGDIALALKNKELTDISREFSGAGIFDLYVFPCDLVSGKSGAGIAERLIHIDNSKPRLRKLDAEIHEPCNLRCKGCLHFSCLVENGSPMQPESFERNLLRLKDFFWGIESIHLLGGEPLLSDRLAEYVRITHGIFPDCDIRVLTNGLLLPGRISLIPKDAAALNCTINVTSYPVAAKNRKKIISALKDAGVPYTATMTRYVFFKSFFAEPQRCSKRHSFKCCMIRPCHGFLNGRLSPCQFSLYLPRLNAAFDEVKLPETDIVNIFDTDMDPWQLVDYLENYEPELCSHCTAGWAPFRWRLLKKGEKPSPGDWLIKPSFFNRVIVQYLFVLASPILKLAYKIMHKIED